MKQKLEDVLLQNEQLKELSNHVDTFSEREPMLIREIENITEKFNEAQKEIINQTKRNCQQNHNNPPQMRKLC